MGSAYLEPRGTSALARSPSLWWRRARQASCSSAPGSWGSRRSATPGPSPSRSARPGSSAASAVPPRGRGPLLSAGRRAGGGPGGGRGRWEARRSNEHKPSQACREATCQARRRTRRARKHEHSQSRNLTSGLPNCSLRCILETFLLFLMNWFDWLQIEIVLFWNG